ncbi:MAG: DUF262 domain-containing protein [Clostridia bacterium]|nr:DUF262 domain-containing protein [Clostridia bacterium]
MDTNWYVDYNDDMEESVKEYDITATPNDFNIMTIFSLIDNGVIKMPPFQRNYVWDEKRASKLIESIILGLPVPQVFLYEQDKNSFYVIDGQQRLLSIYFFIKQRFPTKEGKVALRQYLMGDTKINDEILADDKLFRNFKLRLPALANEEQNKFDKLKYDQLGDYKNTFEIMRTIRSVVIKQNEPDDDSSIYEIFNRLNTGGQNLSPQEIRMSLYYSEFYKELIHLNENPVWRKFLRRDVCDVHFKDVEILLRAFAMLLEYKSYRSPMGKFLNTFSKKTSNFKSETLSYLSSLFLSFLDSCKNLDDNIFCTKNGQFAISLFEAVFVAACYKCLEEKKTLDGNLSQDSILELKENKKFIDSNQGSVASKTNLTTRIEKAIEIIKFE